MILAIRDRMEKRDEGFTLIELLVVVIIIGILAAIAIPTFLRQRERGWAASAESDARNAAINVETVFTNNPAGGYVDGDSAGATDAAKGSLVDFKPSANVTTKVKAFDGTPAKKYCIKAVHSQSPPADTVWLQSDGTLVRSSTSPSTTNCPS